MTTATASRPWLLGKPSPSRQSSRPNANLRRSKLPAAIQIHFRPAVLAELRRQYAEHDAQGDPGRKPPPRGHINGALGVMPRERAQSRRHNDGERRAKHHVHAHRFIDAEIGEEFVEDRHEKRAAANAEQAREKSRRAARQRRAAMPSSAMPPSVERESHAALLTPPRRQCPRAASNPPRRCPWPRAALRARRRASTASSLKMRRNSCRAAGHDRAPAHAA